MTDLPPRPDSRNQPPAGPLVRRATVRRVAGASRAHPAAAAVAVTIAVGLVGLTGLAALAGAAVGPPPAGAVLAGAVPGLTATVAGAYLDAAHAAGRRHPGCVVPAAVVAAIGAVESGHGTAGGATVDATSGVASPPIVGPRLDGSLSGTRPVADSDRGRLDGDPVWDRAVGPMQFLPGSWTRFGVDGDGDATADPHDVHDAAAATVAHLCQAPGPPADLDADPAALRRALAAYNPSPVYIDRVTTLTATYQQLLLPAAAGTGPAGGNLEGLLAAGRLTAAAAAAADLTAGRLDPRAVALLEVLAARWPVHVSVVVTGHSQCVGGGSRAARPGCRISQHWWGRAVDISHLDGLPVDAGNQAAADAVAWLAALPADSPLRPDEVGSPWPTFDPLPGFFHDPAHRDHLHLAWRGDGP